LFQNQVGTNGLREHLSYTQVALIPALTPKTMSTFYRPQSVAHVLLYCLSHAKVTFVGFDLCVRVQRLPRESLEKLSKPHWRGRALLWTLLRACQIITPLYIWNHFPGGKSDQRSPVQTINFIWDKYREGQSLRLVLQRLPVAHYCRIF
jgi:hypothetical protein